MKEFNYPDYLEYQRLESKETNETADLQDSEEKSRLNQLKDGILKMVLEEKKPVVELLNKMLKVKLKETDIEKYENKNIDYMFKKGVLDIIYKMKEKEIYFLIEHRRTIDYNMPKRILEYEMAIIREATNGINLTKENHKLPRVIPIIIYTGDKKWDVEKYMGDCQEILKELNTVDFGEYYVVDANE